MYKGKRVAVVVPAYNVELQIIAVIQGIPEYVDNIIVEDAATDATARLVQLVLQAILIEIQNFPRKGLLEQ